MSFQFHLVRLKAQWERSNPSTFNLFQFHLVRLKDHTSSMLRISIHHFNSI